MVKFYKLFSTFFLASIVQSGFAQQIKLSKDVERALTLVDTNQIKADITYLADDKLKGRAPGTEGFQMAVDYVVGQLKALDVKPAGENDTWLQQVKFRKAFAKDAAFTLSGQPDLKAGTDYIIYPNPETPKISLNASLAFAGYGISEPSLGYDDYAGLDVKGKIVLVMRGAPDKFPSSVAAHTMNTTQILKVAAEHGAVGVIMASADSTSRLPNTSRGIYSVMDKEGGVAVSRIYYSKQVGVFGAFGYKLLNLLLLNSGKSIPSIAAQLKAGQPASFSLPVSVNISCTSVYQDIISYNVVGKIEGSDPELKKTYIVHSAHLDHLGIGTPVKGDSIYNGAHGQRIEYCKNLSEYKSKT
jgi:hypothetical protein